MESYYPLDFIKGLKLGPGALGMLLAHQSKQGFAEAIPYLLGYYPYELGELQEALDNLLANQVWGNYHPPAVRALIRHGARPSIEALQGEAARSGSCATSIYLYIGIGQVDAALRVVLEPALIRYLSLAY